MRVVVQRVKSASCVVDNKLISKIDQGMLVFVGFSNTDTLDIVKKMSLKVSKLRIFEDENLKMNKDLAFVNGNILCISQFTLYGSLKDGNRPSFTESLNKELAKEYYLKFIDELNIFFANKVYGGIFQANMQISLVNDGPVTIILDSVELFL